MTLELLPEMDTGDWHFGRNPDTGWLFVREHDSNVWRYLVLVDVGVDGEGVIGVQSAPVSSLRWPVAA